MATFFSPAKINLFFRLLGKRSDHYHEIASLYQTIDLGDTLKVELTTKHQDTLVCQDSTLGCDVSNLILKASALFRVKTHASIYANFSLIKNIPIQAGLGGGSSNAATTLWALNEMMGRVATLEQLKEWAQELGSDVPFFLSQGTAYCTGRGEIMEEVRIAPLFKKIWIAKPSYGLSTPQVYQTCASCHFEKRNAKQALLDCISGTPQFFNDLELPAFKLKPELAQLKEQLRSQKFDFVTLTGSGTAFVCIGNVNPVPLPGVRFYGVSCLSRDQGKWYAELGL